MKRLKRIFLGALLISLFGFSLAAQPLAHESAEPSVTLKGVSKTSENIKVGFFKFEGYHDVDSDGHRSGYGYDFLQILAKYANFTYTYVGYDSDLTDDIDDGQSWGDMKNDLNLPNTDPYYIDLVTSASKISGYTFSNHDIGTKSAILSVKSGNSSFSDGNYNGIRVGLLAGSSGTNSKFSTYMADKGYSYVSHEYENVADLEKFLQNGEDDEGNKIDAILTSNLRKQTNEWVLTEIDPAPFYVMFKEGNETLRQEVDDAIDEMDSANPSWRHELMQKYYSNDTGEDVPFTSEERNFLNSLVSEGKKLKVAIDPDYFPYGYYEDKKAKGIIPTIFAEIARRMGLSSNYEFVYCATRQEYRDAIYPKADGSHGVDLVLDGVDDFYLAEKNGYKISDSFLSAEVSSLRLKTFTGDEKTIAVPNYAVESPALTSLYESKTVKRCSTMEECVSLVENGEVDATYLPNASARYFIRKDPRNRLGLHNHQWAYEVVCYLGCRL